MTIVICILPRHFSFLFSSIKVISFFSLPFFLLCLSVILSVSICLSFFLPVSLSVCLFVCLSLFLSLCLSVCLSVSLPPLPLSLFVCRVLSNMAPAYLEGMQRIFLSVDKIDGSKDVDSFVSQHEELVAVSPPLPMEKHDFVRVSLFKCVDAEFEFVCVSG